MLIFCLSNELQLSSDYSAKNTERSSGEVSLPHEQLATEGMIAKVSLSYMFSILVSHCYWAYMI